MPEQPYTDAASIDRDLDALRTERDQELERLKEHVQAIADKEHRGTMLKDAVHDMLRSTRAFKWVAGILRRWDR